MDPTITIAGSLAQRLGHGGHAWVFLQYLLGFRSLGYDVLFVDRLEPAMCADATPGWSFEDGENIRFLRSVMTGAGLGDRWIVLFDGGRESTGVPRAEALDRMRRSSLLLNVMGYLDDDELLGAAPLRVFLDIDPGFGQMWRDLGLHDPFVGHDRYVTVGLAIGSESCLVPTGGIDWLTTLPPVALDHWPAQPRPTDPHRFTTVASWRGPFGPIDHGGRTYGLRVHEFRRFSELPRHVEGRFDVALDIDDADDADRQHLLANGWGLLDPRDVAGDPWRYRQFVQQSAAELMVAKNLYVDTRGGWFSDRSACYLASGRPVLAQDTGFGHILPVGEGIVAFSTPDEAAAGADEIVRHYDRHARAAGEIAAGHLDARRVLRRLLDGLGVS